MKYISDGIVHERVLFIPAENIDCIPPFIAGVPDGRWVSYRKGERPKTKSQWEDKIGIKLQKMLK